VPSPAPRESAILSGGYPEARINAVAATIARHRYRGTNQLTAPEARALFDADKLDAIGAIGVARAYATAGAQHRPLFAEVDDAYVRRAPEGSAAHLHRDQHSPAHEHRFKLVPLKDRLHTQTGKRIAAQRHRFMVALFAQLEREVAELD